MYVIKETECSLLRFKSTDTCVTDVDSTMVIHKQAKVKRFSGAARLDRVARAAGNGAAQGNRMAALWRVGQ